MSDPCTSEMTTPGPFSIHTALQICRKSLVSNGEGDLLFEDNIFESLKTGKWAMVGLTSLTLSNMHQAKADAFSDSMSGLGFEPMLSPTRQHHLQAGGRRIVKKADQKPRKTSTPNSSIANSTSIQVSLRRRLWSGVRAGDVLPPHNLVYVHDEPVGGDQQAALERRHAHPERSGVQRLRRTFPTRLLNIRRSRCRKYQETRQDAERILGPKRLTGSSQMKELGHPVVRGTANLEHCSLTQKRQKREHSLASAESVSMISRLIESANHLCILLRTPRNFAITPHAVGPLTVPSAESTWECDKMHKRSGNWERKALQNLHTHIKNLVTQFFPSTAILEQGTLKQKARKDNFFFHASAESDTFHGGPTQDPFEGPRNVSQTRFCTNFESVWHHWCDNQTKRRQAALHRIKIYAS